jgi:predicted YcjX-like family ATPase
MATATKTPRAISVYDSDFQEWTKQQARALTARRAADIDWDNVAEEIASLGRAEKNEIKQRLIRLLQHLLKWEFQPQRRCHSWQSTISAQRIHIQGVIESSPSLRSFPGEAAARAYENARRQTSIETALPISTFPEELPYRIEDVLRPDFMPGRPWSPDELIRD